MIVCSLPSRRTVSFTLLPGGSCDDVVAQDVAVLDRCAVDRGDHVAAAHAGLFGRAASLHRVDQRAAHVARARGCAAMSRGHRLDRHAEHAALHLAVVDQLRHDVLRHVRGNREADADVAARRRQDLRVDADQLAARC